MTNWHSGGYPYTPHNPPKYWSNVLDNILASNHRATTPIRNDAPRVVSWQPPQTTSTVVRSSGLADGPSGQ